MENLHEEQTDTENNLLNKSTRSISFDENQVSLTSLFNLMSSLKKECRHLDGIKK